MKRPRTFIVEQDKLGRILLLVGDGKSVDHIIGSLNTRSDIDIFIETLEEHQNAPVSPRFIFSA